MPRPGGWLFQASRRVRYALDRSRLSEHTLLMGFALTVGIAGGFGAVGFRGVIRGSQWLFFEQGHRWLGVLGHYGIVLIPAIGGAVVGLIVRFLAREAKGHGVPEVMEAVARRGGVIRPRTALGEALASAITIGSGGSVGRHGPIVHIGASIGSIIGQLFRLSDARLRNLVACGAAAGIAAEFNAPLAGAFFALEVIHGEFTAESFGTVVIAAVGASAVGWRFFGDDPAFAVPQYGLASLSELPAFALLGVLAAIVGVGVIRLLYVVEDVFDRIPIPGHLKPALGGLGVGALGLFAYRSGQLPWLWGVGYEAIEQVLRDQFVPALVLGLFLLKPVAMSLSLGSGGSGGIFAPSLYIGAMLGCLLGVGLNSRLPGAVAQPAAYALVGMGAVFAATSHAPITAIVILFEMTRDYHMVLPLMFACGLATFLSRRLSRDSIFTAKLVRRGVHVSLGRDVNLLNSIEVGEAMATDLVTVDPQTPVREVLHLLEQTKHHGFPLVGAEDGKLHGIITLTDVRRALDDGDADVPASQVATHRLLVCFPNETLNDALRKLGLRDVGRIPVVDPEDHSRLLGLITRKNIIEAYNRGLIRGHTDLEATIETETFR